MNTRSKASAQPAPARPTTAPVPAKKSRKAKGKAKSELFEDANERAARDIHKGAGSASANRDSQRVVSKDLVGRLMSNRPGESSSAPSLRKAELDDEQRRGEDARTRKETRESLLRAVDYESEEETVAAQGLGLEDRGRQEVAEEEPTEADDEETERPEVEAAEGPPGNTLQPDGDQETAAMGSRDGRPQRRQQRDSPRPTTNEPRGPKFLSGTKILLLQSAVLEQLAASLPPRTPSPPSPTPTTRETKGKNAAAAFPRYETPDDNASPPSTPRPRLLSAIEEEDEDRTQQKGISYADYDLESDFEMEDKLSGNEYLMDVELPVHDGQSSQDEALDTSPRPPGQPEKPALPTTTTSPTTAGHLPSIGEASNLLTGSTETATPKQKKRKHRRGKSSPADATVSTSPPAATVDHEPVSGAWIKPKKTARLRESSKAKILTTAPTEQEPARKRTRVESPSSPLPSPAPTGPQDLLDAPRGEEARPAKRQKAIEEKTARVPHKHSLKGPIVHKSNTLAQLLPPPPVPTVTAAPPAQQAGTSYATPTRHGGHGNEPAGPRQPNEGVLPERRPRIIFSRPPPGGYALIEGPNPMWPYCNMEEYSKVYYGRVKTGKTLAIAFGYTYAETQLALPAPLAGIAVDMIAEYLHIDADTIETANPVSIPNPANPSLGPWGVLVHGLSRRQERKLVKRRCLAANGVGILLLAVLHHIPSHLINIRGPHNKKAKQIRHVVRQKLRETQNTTALIQIARQALPGDTRSDEKLARDIIKSVQVDRLEAHAKGGIKDPSYNVSLPPLCERVDTWHQVHDLFMGIDYSSELGPAEITRHIRCLGCHGANHFGGLCTYDKSETWYGPPAGISAMSPKDVWEAKRAAIAAYLRDLRLL